MMPDPSVDRLTASVLGIRNAADAFIASYHLLAADMRNVAGDRVATVALADSLDAKAADIVAAATSGTPVVLPPPVENPPLPTV